mgnify:FL=1
MENLTEKEWDELIVSVENPVILDVRTPLEYLLGRIEHAQLIDFNPVERFTNEVEKLDREGHYFIYCKSGHRSFDACLLMTQMGFKNTYNLLGGIIEWKGKTVR